MLVLQEHCCSLPKCRVTSICGPIADCLLLASTARNAAVSSQNLLPALVLLLEIHLSSLRNSVCRWQLLR